MDMSKQSGTLALEKIFTRSFPQKVKQLQKTFRQLEEAWDPAKLTELEFQLTKIGILAESLHLNQVHAQCQSIIHTIEEIQNGTTRPSEETATLLEAQIELLNRASSLMKVPLHVDKETMEKLKYHTRLLIAIPQAPLAQEYIKQFSFFGYECIQVHDFKQLNQALKKEEHFLTFAALIIDIAFCDVSSLKAFESLPSNLPIIFISEQDSVALRLFAVRAGGHAFFARPVEFNAILEKIDQLIIPVQATSPYRVLMVEDSKTQANIIKLTLEKAGIMVMQVVDPFEINEALQDFQPELILMDIYMPKCNGIELASVIRQQDAYVGTPIVFLSAENNLTKQMDAMRLGGDDFLTKPIEEDHLIAAISTRIDRGRAIRATMIQDGLTGLLNHTPILEQLNTEIARAERDNTALSLAIIDLDHFKKINDTYGHQIGDKVLKGLARLFKQRFRKSDSLGRYGGEEFVAILPNADAKRMKPMIDEIRVAFSQIDFQSHKDQIFHVTFSAGLASLSENIRTPEKLIQAADKAMYQAKKAGRDQIKIYQEDE